MKIAVIGVGGVGSAACRFGARGGHEVVGFEQFLIGHPRGSSHGESRIIRYTYPDLLYTQMMGDAYPLWAELEEEAGQELFVRCGGVLFGPREHERVRATRDALAAAGLPFETLEPDEASQRFPAFALRPDEIALFQRQSGFLRSSRCILANARLAREAGAELREEAPVCGLEPRSGGVVVRTARGEELFDRVIVTAGAWMGRLLEGCGLPLQVEQRQIMYVSIARHHKYFEAGQMPVWIDAGAFYYGFPSDGQLAGVKLASHVRGAPFNPDDEARPVIEENVEHALAYARERLPDTGGHALHAQACLYTVTPDEHFVLDRAPGLENVWLCSACSGHGFKFTILLGKLMVDLATGGSYERDLSRFSASRFNTSRFA